MAGRIVVSDVIEREIFIGAGIEHVWSLVSKAGFWIGEELRFDKQAVEGELIVIDTANYGDFPVRVERLEPPHYAAYRWASAFPGEAPNEENSTLVEFALAEQEGGVIVRVTESGFSSLTGGRAVRQAAWEANAAGWRQQLDLLRQAAVDVDVG